MGPLLEGYRDTGWLDISSGNEAPLVRGDEQPPVVAPEMVIVGKDLPGGIPHGPGQHPGHHGKLGEFIAPDIERGGDMVVAVKLVGLADVTAGHNGAVDGAVISVAAGIQGGVLELPLGKRGFIGGDVTQQRRSVEVFPVLVVVKGHQGIVIGIGYGPLNGVSGRIRGGDIV